MAVFLEGVASAAAEGAFGFSKDFVAASGIVNDATGRLRERKSTDEEEDLPFFEGLGVADWAAEAFCFFALCFFVEGGLLLVAIVLVAGSAVSSFS